LIFLDAKEGGALEGSRLGLWCPSGGRPNPSRGLLSLYEYLDGPHTIKKKLLK